MMVFAFPGISSFKTIQNYAIDMISPVSLGGTYWICQMIYVYKTRLGQSLALCSPRVTQLKNDWLTLMLHT